MSIKYKHVIKHLKPMISRMGGKNYFKKKIVDKYFIDDYINYKYVEPFFGGGSIFFYKDYGTKEEIINDLDTSIYIVLKGLQKYNWDSYKDLVNIDMDKVLFEKIKTSNPTTEKSLFLKNLILFKYSYYGKQKHLNSRSKPVNMNFEAYKERLKNTIILNQDYKDVILKYDSPDTFFYLDPPYEMSKKTHYKHHEFNLKELHEILKNIKGKFLLSYNESEMATELFKDYYINYDTTIYVGHKKKTEIIISNYKI